jgi:hypothetical protein
VVLADSHEIPRAPCYSGTPEGRRQTFTYRALTVYGRPSQTSSATPTLSHSPQGRQTPQSGTPQPHTRNPCRVSHAHGLASSPSAHHYSGNHYCFLFQRVLRCFTSPRSHQPPYTFRRRRHPTTSARLPHSEIPGSKSGCRLPEAYRRLPRPSSAPDAKASTVCPQKLDHTKQTGTHKPPTPQRKSREPARTGNLKMLASTIHKSTHKPDQPTPQKTFREQTPANQENTHPHPPPQNGSRETRAPVPS